MTGVGYERRTEPIVSFLQDQKGEIVEFLKALTIAESPSSEPASHPRVLAVLSEALEREGLCTRPLRGLGAAVHLYACPRSPARKGSVQLMLGHYDTVWPTGTLSDMPFVVEDNVVKGPGVFDMKGGLAQIVFALRTLRTLRLEPHLTPVVFVNCDEEIGSHGSKRYVRALARRAERVFVLEPALGPSGKIKTARKAVGQFTVRVTGKAAHAGLEPEAGVSAILELSHVIQKLFSLNDPERGVTVNVGTIDGGLRPNVIAPTSEAVADVRAPTAEDASRVEREILSMKPTTPGVTLDITGSIGRPALERTPRNQRLWELAVELGRQLGMELEEGVAGGGSDGSTASQYAATLDGLGPVGDGAHARHEFLYLDRTIERTALLTMLLAAPSVDDPTAL
jgi:glutamate carboxypeptidase